jgi:hypothetical protein
MSQSRTPCPICARQPGTPHALECARSQPSLRRQVGLELAARGQQLPADGRSYREALTGDLKRRWR